MDVAGRLLRLSAAVTDVGCDALLVSHLTNIRYLTGFTGSAATLLVSVDGALLVTDGRYQQQAAEQLAAAGVEADIEIGNSPRQHEILRKAASAIARLGVEAGHVSWAEQRKYANEVFVASELVP